MSRDLTPTAVVRRPVEKEIAQEDYFSKRTKYVSFMPKQLTRVWAPANCIIAHCDKGTLIVYSELSTMTVKMIFKGLHSIYVKAGERVKEGEAIGSALGFLKFTITRLTDGESVQPEFFYEADINEETPPDQMA